MANPLIPASNRALKHSLLSPAWQVRESGVLLAALLLRYPAILFINTYPDLPLGSVLSYLFRIIS